MQHKARGCLALSFLCWGKLKTLDIPEWIGYVPDFQPYHLIITSAYARWSYKLTKPQITCIVTVHYSNNNVHDQGQIKTLGPRDTAHFCLVYVITLFFRKWAQMIRFGECWSEMPPFCQNGLGGGAVVMPPLPSRGDSIEERALWNSWEPENMFPDILEEPAGTLSKTPTV